MSAARRHRNGLGVLVVLGLLGGCADAEQPFSSTSDEAQAASFTVEVEARPSRSVRTESTNTLWFAGAFASFSTDFALPAGAGAARPAPAGAGGGGMEDDPGDGDHADEASPHDSPDEHGEDQGDDAHGDDGGEEGGCEEHGGAGPGEAHEGDHAGAVRAGEVEAQGYDIEVSFLPPQPLHRWHEKHGEWEEEAPLPGAERYLLVRLGSSAGTGGRPHVHGSWASEAPFADDLSDEEKEEAFAGIRQLVPGSTVRLTVAPEEDPHHPVIAGVELAVVETGHGSRLGGNFEVDDGVYDVTITVESPRVARLDDARATWSGDLTFEFHGVEIRGADGAEGVDARGRHHRTLDAGEAARYVVLEDWDGVGHGHPHRMVLPNHKGDVSQSHGDHNTLVCQLRASAAQNLYEGGAFIGPREPVTENAIYLEVVLYDPCAPLRHGRDEFFDLSGTSVKVTVINEASGEGIEVGSDDMFPVYSHEHGFHYGLNFALPGGAAPVMDEEEVEEEEGGGHGHAHG